MHKSSGNRDETVANKIQIKETLDFLLVFVLIQSNATLIFFKRYLDIKETFVFNLLRLLIVYVGDFRQHCGGESSDTLAVGAGGAVVQAQTTLSSFNVGAGDKLVVGVAVENGAP